MGSLGNHDDETEPVKKNSTIYREDFETQPFDSQSSPHSHPGNDIKDKDFDEANFLQCTLPFVDTVPFEDGLETQVMDFAGETQVLDDIDGFENMDTQLLDEGNNEGEADGGETDKTEMFCDTDDIDGFENMDTQLLDEWNNKGDTDGEETDKTEMLCDTEELSDNDSVKIVGSFSTAQENITTIKQDDKEPEVDLDALFYEQTTANVKMDFTSIRAAALRASGMAARSKALRESNHELCSLKGDNDSSKDPTPKDNGITGVRDSLAGEEVDEDASEYNGQMNGIRNESKGRIGNLAVRRLFVAAKDEGFDNNLNADGAVDLPQCNEIAGLSYVDSQEPGELSQANALEFVDRFLKSNDMDFDQGIDIGRSTGKKLEPLSSVKGTKNLAKRSNLKSKDGEVGIFDWDDNLEDEGGGEFFSRKKEALLGNEGLRRNSYTEPLKIREEQLRIHQKGKGLPHSSLPLKLHRSTRNGKTAKVAEIKKNLTTYLDKQLKNDLLDGMEATGTNRDVLDMLNVGPDTQMAAEAMEVLCFGLDVADHGSKDTNQSTKNTSKLSSGGGKEDKEWSKKYSLRKRSSSSSCGDFTRKSKQGKITDTNLSKLSSVPSSKQTKSAKKQCEGFDAINVISPSRGRGQIGICTPIASRTRQRSVTCQSIDGNITYGKTAALEIGELSRKRGRRSQRKLSDNGNGSINQFVGKETNEKSCETSNRSNSIPLSFSVDPKLKRKTRSSVRAGPAFPSSDRYSDRRLYCQSGDKEGSEEGTFEHKLTDGHMVDGDIAGGNAKLEVSPGERCKLSVSTSTTPASCTSSGIAESPVCMGDEYRKQSCRKNLSRSFLMKEINSLVSYGPESTSIMKESRRRRDMANVRVLFSHHLDEDIIKQQKKILAKLGASVASCISEATHFVADKFVRTRNILETIAFGKPVVTHLWLESCGQASCCIEEKNYILRDAKKEKEFGFSLPVSLARACQRPLLKGLKVWITPSTKPGKEILASLVKAVHGLPVERVGRSVLKDDKIPDDLLVLSCEEDYATCVPFLEKGGAVYSSELLLNGIVTQKLEYERHRLFEDHVRKTRSTIWLKRDNNQYIPVAKHK